MMMGIAVLQGRLLAAAGSENNSLHLLMSADHHFIILMSVGHIHHFRTIMSTDHYIMRWQLIIASSAAYNFIIDVNGTFPRLVDVNRSSLHHIDVSGSLLRHIDVSKSSNLDSEKNVLSCSWWRQFMGRLLLGWFCFSPNMNFQMTFLPVSSGKVHRDKFAKIFHFAATNTM